MPSDQSAVSDGGEDQGAEEVSVHGALKNAKQSSRQFWKQRRLARAALPFQRGKNRLVWRTPLSDQASTTLGGSTACV